MSENEKVFEATDENFSASVVETKGLTIIDFWAVWCGPCRIVGPLVDQLAEEYADRGVRVGKLDVDSNPETSAAFGIRSIPSILFFKDGEHVDTVIGAVPRAHLVEKVEAHL
jgi:thioredoxin 1